MTKTMTVKSVIQKTDKINRAYLVITLDDNRNYAFYGETPNVGMAYDCDFTKNGKYDNLTAMRIAEVPVPVGEPLPSGIPEEDNGSWVAGPPGNPAQEAYEPRAVAAPSPAPAPPATPLAPIKLAPGQVGDTLCPRCKIIVANKLLN